MTWWMWSIVANVTIAVIEYLNRKGGFEDFWHAVPYTGPLILLAQVGLFYTWRDAPAFMLAWAVFTIGNTGLRVLSAQFAVQEPLNLPTMLGVALILAGGQLVKMGVMR